MIPGPADDAPPRPALRSAAPVNGAPADAAPAATAPASPAVFQRLDLNTRYPYSRTEYARRFLWGFVQATLYRWAPRRAYGWRSALLRRFGARIGSHVRLRPRVSLLHPWLLEVGDWSSVADDVVIYNLGPVSIGRHSAISQGVYLCAGTHDYTRPDLPLQRPPIRIGDGVWVAAQAFIGPGVTIGDNTVVGARAVVTRDLPAGVVAAGNPAAVLKPRPMGDRRSP